MRAIALCPSLLQKKQQIMREDLFRKWLQSKVLARTLGSAVSKQNASVQPWSLASKSLEQQIIKSFQYPSIEAQLKSLPSPTVPPKPIYKQSKISRPKIWNCSPNPARPRITDIGHPQGIRLGVHPEPCKEHDFCRYLEMTQNKLGGACLRTVDCQLVKPVPQLPFEVMIRVLYPGTRPYRMKVPQGFYARDILKVPQKRHLRDTCTKTVAMSLRDTFDEPFLASLEACQT